MKKGSSLFNIPSFSGLTRESSTSNYFNFWRRFRTFDGKSTAKPLKGNKLALQFRHLHSVIGDAQTVFPLRPSNLFIEN